MYAKLRGYWFSGGIGSKLLTDGQADRNCHLHILANLSTYEEQKFIKALPSFMRSIVIDKVCSSHTTIKWGPSP